MCTVSYLPLSGGFILTSNRDEWNKRLPALPPQEYIIHNKKIIFPKDQKANGTWIALSDDFTLCLLNGAFVRHESTGNYRLSRGIMLLDFFQYNNLEDFINSYNFIGIENFTLLIKSNKGDQFNEIRWDGTQLHNTVLASELSHIWSSSTLYSDEVINERRQWFSEWVKIHPQFDQKEIIHFHRFAGKGDEQNDVIMRRDNGVQTVSITSIVINEKSGKMTYFDLDSTEEFELEKDFISANHS